MAKSLRKQRWESWENICIQAAFTQDIQYKIMATALKRTVSSVNKKIKVLGLRPPSSLRGRIKGKKAVLPRMEKMPRDMAKMIEILRTYAPLEYFQEGQLALQKGYWTHSQATLYSNKKGEKCFDAIAYADFPYSFVKTLEFFSSTTLTSPNNRIKRIAGDPAYVPLYFIEKWAASEGFHKIRGILQRQGFSYWKNGTYFSQTQLLMHVNRIRFTHHLQPIVLMEEEESSAG